MSPKKRTGGPGAPQIRSLRVAARGQAAEIIQEIEGFGVTLTSTSASMPRGMLFEDWQRVMTLLADLHILAGVPDLVPELDDDVVIADPEMQARLFIDGVDVATPAEDAELEASIRDIGVLVPLIVWAETRILLDGYRRLAVARKYGIPYEVQTISKESWEDAVRFRLEFQLARKQYTPEELTEAREAYARVR